MVDDTTKATFEGIAKMGEGIGEGVIELANNGVIVVEEFTNQFAKLPLFRRVMDCEPIVIWKMGEEKHIEDVNITMLTACNPTQDFFVEELEFRKQLSFKEGVLSRFDFLIPLTATQIKNEILLDKIDIMTPQAKLNGINLDEIRENLETIATGMSQITRVILTPQQSDVLKDAFRGRNDMDMGRRLLGYRPLVILRDLETLARMVNIVAAVNFSKRIPSNGVIQADDSDVEKAIQLWEGLIQFRVQLYAKHDRNLLSVGDEIVKYIIQAQQSSNGDAVDIRRVKQRIVDEMKLIGQTTFYKEVNILHESGRIAVEGQRDKKLSVIVK
jgi:DNA replicative helicase MCM subunit Mcm2 (Cdc46/Mcm family)